MDTGNRRRGRPKGFGRRQAHGDHPGARPRPRCPRRSGGRRRADALRTGREARAIRRDHAPGPRDARAPRTRRDQRRQAGVARRCGGLPARIGLPAPPQRRRAEPVDDVDADAGDRRDLHLGVEKDGNVLFVSQVETHETIRAFFPPGSCRRCTRRASEGAAEHLRAGPDRERLFRGRTFARFTDKTIGSLDQLRDDVEATAAGATRSTTRSGASGCAASPPRSSTSTARPSRGSRVGADAPAVRREAARDRRAGAERRRRGLARPRRARRDDRGAGRARPGLTSGAPGAERPSARDAGGADRRFRPSAGVCRRRREYRRARPRRARIRDRRAALEAPGAVTAGMPAGAVKLCARAGPTGRARTGRSRSGRRSVDERSWRRSSSDLSPGSARPRSSRCGIGQPAVQHAARPASQTPVRPRTAPNSPVPPPAARRAYRAP